jgi:hypothetical protein
MRRSPELAPLSRDHHRALAVAMWLRRDAPEARERFAEFWAADGPAHFAVEEAVLTTELLSGDEDWSAGVARMTAEHRELEELAGRLVGGDREAGGTLGERLDAHVRYEERELFPMLEERAGAELLAQLGATITELRGR